MGAHVLFKDNIIHQVVVEAVLVLRSIERTEVRGKTVR
jgi:hypothetical protein